MQKKSSWSSHKKGVFYENCATIYLQCKGYSLLRKRYKTPVGEIDLLMCRGDTLVGVEIKQRKHQKDVMSAITPFQQRRIQKCLLWASQHFPQFCNLRIDTVLISPFKWPIHIQNAF